MVGKSYSTGERVESYTPELVIGIGVENEWDRAIALVSEWR